VTDRPKETAARVQEVVAVRRLGVNQN